MYDSGAARRRAGGGGTQCAVRAPALPSRARRFIAAAACEALEQRRLLTGSISGTIFRDVNANGSLDSGDPGIAGVTVYLDTDNSMSFNGGDVSTTSNSSGVYTFPSVADGTYSIGEVTPSGHVRTGSTFVSATVAGGAVTNKHLANFPYVFDGGNGTDTWTIKLDPANTTRVQILETLLGHSTVSWTITRSSIPSITINANSGDDVLVVDYANGDPLPAGGINFDGSSQSSSMGDRITVSGGGGADVIALSSLDVASGAGLIAVKNLEGATLNGGLGNDSISLRIGMPFAIPCDGQGGVDTLTFSGSENGDMISMTPNVVGDLSIANPYSGFELLEIKSKGGSDHVDVNDTSCASTFDLGDGNDEMVVNIAHATSVGVLGGDGDDKLTLLQDILVPVSFTGGNGTDRVTVTGSNGNDTIDITGAQVMPQGSLFTVSYTAEALCVDGADGHDTITANLGGSAAPVTVLGGSGNDALTTLSGASIVFDDSIGTNTATFNASGSAETITLSGNTIVTAGRALAALGVQNWVVNAMGGHDTINLTSALSANNVTVNGGDGNDALTISTTPSAAVCYNGGLSVADSDTLNVNAGVYTFAADAATGSANLALNVGAAGAVNFDSSQHLASLSVIGHATLTPGGGKVLRTRSLAVSGWLDLADNDLIVDYSSTSPMGSWSGSAYTGVTGLIQAGMNGGGWDGSGLRTSSSGMLPGLYLGLGCAEASEVIGLGAGQTEVWSGETVDSTCVLVKFTYMGDYDLNGELNGDDYFYLDSHIVQSGSVFGYYNGDTDYNGELNGDDYFYIDANIPAQSVVL